MMILAAIVGMIKSLLLDFILFYVGRILTMPNQLRAFLGLEVPGESAHVIYDIAYWVSKIGYLLKVVAVVDMVVTLIITFEVIF